MSNALETVPRSKMSMTEREYSDSQFIFLRVGQLPQVDPFQLDANGRGEIFDFLRGSEERFLLGVGKEPAFRHLDVADGVPVHYGPHGLCKQWVWVSYAIEVGDAGGRERTL